MQTIRVEKLQLAVADLFSKDYLRSLATTAQVDAWEDERAVAWGVKLRAYIAALPGERIKVQFPTSWWDHAKHDLRQWLRDRCRIFDQYGSEEYVLATRQLAWLWVFKWASKLLTPPQYTTKEVQQYLSVCPHLGLRPNQADCVYALHALDHAFHNADEEVLP